MIRASLLIIVIFFSTACTKEPKTTELSDDYVLIEFAARLEEDYQRLYPEPLDKAKTTPAE